MQVWGAPTDKDLRSSRRDRPAGRKRRPIPRSAGATQRLAQDPYNGSAVRNTNVLLTGNRFWGNVGGDIVNAAFADSVIVNNVITGAGGRAIDLFPWLTVSG